MKVILDFDDNILSEMQLHADIIQEDLNVMLSNLFVQTVLEPAQILRQEQSKDNCKELDLYHASILEFINDLIHDPKNNAMQPFLLRLRDEHLSRISTLTDLYKSQQRL